MKKFVPLVCLSRQCRDDDIAYSVFMNNVMCIHLENKGLLENNLNSSFISFTLETNQSPWLVYRRVSKVHEIFNALFFIENDVIKVNSNEQALNYLIDTTSVFWVLFLNSTFYSNTIDVSNLFSYFYEIVKNISKLS